MELNMKALSVALAALLATSAAAAAQTTTTQPSTTTEPSTTTTTTDSQFYKRQEGDKRASRLIGKRVINAANETVGEINDVFIGKDAKPTAVLLGVGGFLGLGEREVAVNYDALRFSKDAKGHTVVTINMTKDQFDRAPSWKRSPATKTDTPRPQ
jgi:hypothetical protein